MLIDEKLAMDFLIIRIIMHKPAIKLIEHLRLSRYGVTNIDAHRDTNMKVHVLYTMIPRKHLKKILRIINTDHPKAFYSVEDLKIVSDGEIFPKTIKKNFTTSIFSINKKKVNWITLIF